MSSEHREGDPCPHCGRRLRILHADRMRRRLSVASRIVALMIAEVAAGGGSSPAPGNQLDRLRVYDVRCLRCDNVTRVWTSNDTRKRRAELKLRDYFSGSATSDHSPATRRLTNENKTLRHVRH